MNSKQITTSRNPSLKTPLGRAVQKVLRQLVEAKAYPFGLATTISSAGTLQHVSGLAQDATNDGRVGLRVILKFVEFTYSWQVNSADFFNQARFIVFVWKGDNQNDPPTLASILDDRTSGSVPPTQYLYNWDERQKYRILYDNIQQLTASSYGVGPSAANFGVVNSITVTRKPVHCNIGSEAEYYQGSLTGTGQLYLLLVSDSTIASHPSLQLAGRLIYEDA